MSIVHTLLIAVISVGVIQIQIQIACDACLEDLETIVELEVSKLVRNHTSVVDDQMQQRNVSAT